MANDNGLYTEEETGILELTKKARVDTLKEMIKGGVPTRSGDIRVLTELSTSLDKVITDAANTRLKSQDVTNNANTIELVKNTLLHARRRMVIDTDKVIELPEDMVLETIVPGQKDINPDKLDPSEFVEQ